MFAQARLRDCDADCDARGCEHSLAAPKKPGAPEAAAEATAPRVAICAA